MTDISTPSPESGATNSDSASAPTDSDDLESGSPGVVMKHLYGFQGVLLQILVHQLKLRYQIGCGGNDVAAAGLRLKKVQKLPWAGPKQFRIGELRKRLDARPHNGLGIHAGIGNRSEEHTSELQ